MTLEELAARLPELVSMPHGEKIKIFAWWLQHDQKVANLQPRDISRCYSELSLAPTNVHSMLDWFKQRKVFLKTRDGYRLERSVLDGYTREYGQREAAIHVEKLLTDLPPKLAKPDERAYLEETLTCFRHRAFRAAVTMAWNLAYDHICYWLLADLARLAAFNTQLGKTYAKRNYSPIGKRDDFEDIKEFEVIQVLASAALINGGVHTILKEKLDRRNKAAHASGIVIHQSTAESVIVDLIENVVLKLQ